MRTGLLLAYAAALAATGTWVLPRASWPYRVPRMGIAVWLALTATVAASVTLAGLALTVPCLRAGPLELLRNCTMAALRAQYTTVGGDVAGAVGALLALTVVGRFAWSTGAGLTVAARRRARHDEALALIARPGPVPGVLLLDHDHPAAYCLPGHRRIVLTTGALRHLSSPNWTRSWPMSGRTSPGGTI